MTFTAAELEYLGTQRLGRLATLDEDGKPQVNPVGFFVREDGTVDIGGHAMGRTRKWRNARGNPHVSLVVDDLASVRPWTVRGVEIRGEAETLTVPGGPAPGPGFSDEVIRIHPRRIISWGVAPGAAQGASSRDVRA